MVLDNYLNIILFGLYVLVSLLFLREFVNPKRWTVGILEHQVRRTYIVKKYLPYYGVLIFITGIIFLL